MKCKRPDCPNEVVRVGRANNKNYCSVECRDIHYRERNAERIKANSNRHNHARWNKYEEGKEKCVICEANGEEAWYWAVCHHAAHRHGVSHKEYKKLIGADLGKGRLPEKLKKIKRKHVFDNGTVKNLEKGASCRYKPNDPRAGRYERSAETLDRLKHQLHKK